MPAVGNSVYSDLLNTALGEVNWHEIAESIIEGVKAEIDAEEKAEAGA